MDEERLEISGLRDRNLRAAQWWLDIGNPLCAKDEVEKIESESRDHPDVLQVQWHIFAEMEHWTRCVAIASRTVDIHPEHAAGGNPGNA